MNKEGKIKRIYSWPVIFILLLYFWPVGLFLIYKRLSLEENRALAIADGLGKGAVMWMVLSIIVAIGVVIGTGAPLMVFPILLSNGIIALIMRRISKKIKRQEEYLSIVQNRETMSVAELVAASGNSYKVVNKDIKRMIRKGKLKNTVVDESQSRIIFNNVVSKELNNVVSKNLNNVSAKELNNVAPKDLSGDTKEQPVAIKLERYLTRVVSCSNCGAKNVRNEDIQTCEYCGSQIQ